MSNLSSLGVFHTAIGLIALVSGVLCLARDGAIAWRSGAGKVYILATLVVCLTGLGIFAHGGFGKPHGLAIVTLLALGLAGLAEGTGVFGKASAYVATLGYSATFFFHLIPTVAETTTRLPVGAPLFDSAEAPGLQALPGAVMLALLICVALQVRKLRASRTGRGSARPA